MSLAKKTVILSAVLSLSAAIAGCGVNGNQMRQQGQNINQVQTGNQSTIDARNQNRPVENRFEVADDAAEQITRIPGIRQANVLVTENNAFVAAILDTNRYPNNGKVSREIEEQIAQKVRSVDPSIQNVFVSTNPEFVDRVNAYADDFRKGHPVAGFVEQLNVMIQRIFPTAR